MYTPHFWQPLVLANLKCVKQALYLMKGHAVRQSVSCWLLPRLNHVLFVMDKVAQGRFYPVGIIWSMDNSFVSGSV